MVLLEQDWQQEDQLVAEMLLCDLEQVDILSLNCSRVLKRKIKVKIDPMDNTQDHAHKKTKTDMYSSKDERTFGVPFLGDTSNMQPLQFQHSLLTTPTVPKDQKD